MVISDLVEFRGQIGDKIGGQSFGTPLRRRNDVFPLTEAQAGLDLSK